MAWTVKAKKQARKFINKQDKNTQNRVREALNKLVGYLENGIFPFNEMDIKKLHAERKGSYRLRIGDIRIIFTPHISSRVIEINKIDYRGDVYK